MSLNLPRHEAGTEINAADWNVQADLLEALLNGPGAVPAGTGLADDSFAENFPVAVVQTISGASPVRLGKTILLRVAASPHEPIQFVYDTTLGKWVSDPFPAIGQLESTSTSSAGYVDTNPERLERRIIPNFKALYDAGVRPQAFVSALLDNDGANDTFLRAAIREFNDNDGTLSAEILTGGEIVNNGTTGRYQVADWATMTGTAPTKTHGLLLVQVRCTAGTGTIDTGSVWLRWVSA